LLRSEARNPHAAGAGHRGLYVEESVGHAAEDAAEKERPPRFVKWVRPQRAGCYLQARLDDHYESPRPVLKDGRFEAQSGFTRKRRCSDGSISLRQALKWRREYELESWVLFVDLVKAFDSLPRGVLRAVFADLAFHHTSSVSSSACTKVLCRRYEAPFQSLPALEGIGFIIGSRSAQNR